MTSYSATAGSHRAPTNCTISGNVVWANHGTGEVFATTDMLWGIYVGGVPTTPLATNNIIIGNTVSGYGDSNGTIGTNPPGGITGSNISIMNVANNSVYSSGRNGIAIFAAEKVSITGNTIDTIGGTASTAASGTITFAGNPSNGDTITINTAVYTFVNPAAPANDYEIDIKGTLPLTLDEIISVLNSATGPVTALQTDGRVSTATYTEDGTSALTITFDTIGTAGNSFSIAASAATASGACLTGGAVGSSGILVAATESAIAYNLVDVGTHTAISGIPGCATLDIGPNTNRGTGPKYDFGGTSTTFPQSLAVTVRDMWSGAVYDYNVPSIGAGSYYEMYVPAPGSCTRYPRANVNILDTTGLSIIPTTFPSANYIRLRLNNFTAGAIDLPASTDIMVSTFK
jgi:putative cofactor-binding repeat protein